MTRLSASSAADRTRRDDCLITATLDTRAHRPPDYEAESGAMHHLARALTAPDGDVLQTLADMALGLCEAGSAGIGLLETDADGTRVFRWVAVSGACVAALGSTTPIADSPGGVTLELGAGQLFSLPQGHFAGLKHVSPYIIEELVVPIPGELEPWGILWVMSHDREHLFDSEGCRILTSLANFTCAALTITRAKADAEARAAEAEAARNAVALTEAHKEDFIATLSHELHNPIAPIDSSLSAMRRLVTDNPAALSVLSVAERQMRQLKRLVSDLQDASRIRHGKLSIRPSHCLLQDIATDAVTTAKAEADKRQHRLHVTLPSYPVAVFADPARLTQVISNLLSNAVKYTPPGGDITLTVEAPSTDSIPANDFTPREAIITVGDNGAGISAALLPHVFEFFTQAASARTRAEGGLGIGLSVVKYLVNAHNGTLDIFSAGEGHGTQVTVRLPIVCREIVEPDNVATLGMTPIRILLVDDNADATEALGILLELEGHEVKRAQSGPDALSIVDSFTPDVALIDITMPGMDGLELAQLLRLRAQCSLTKLVALTGSADVANSEQTDERIFDCRLVKPLSLDDLTDVMRS